MDVYMYQAALLCEGCGERRRGGLRRAGNEPPNIEDECSYDSDRYPKGPFCDGGGEADSPQHCDHCSVFLENALTSDGYGYLSELADMPEEWVEFYRWTAPPSWTPRAAARTTRASTDHDA